MNVGIVELYDKDEREFSLMSKVREDRPKIVFWTVSHSKNIFIHNCLLNKNQAFCFERSVDKASKNDTRCQSLLLTDVALEIPIKTCLSFFKFFIHGHHVHQHIWTPIVGEKYCIREIENKQDKNSVAVFHEERVVGRILVVVSKFVNMFLSLPGSYLEAEVTGKRIIQGEGIRIGSALWILFNWSREGSWLDKKNSFYSIRTHSCCK